MSDTATGTAVGARHLLDRASDIFFRVFAWMRPAGQPLLFGLRLWGAVCLALYVSFWLEIDTPYWAATTAAIVCQPSLGASLRKASFRVVGTIIGAIVIVGLTAAFPQSRVGFLLALALWGALCGLVASVLQNFAAYAAALAGYTAVIIASDELGPTGGANGDVLMLAINRGSEICIGIVCAGLVLAGTDFGHARRRLVAQFSGIVMSIGNGLSRTFALTGPDLLRLRLVRRELIRKVAALGPAIDEAIGESSELRYRSRALQIAVDGLFSALGGWRAVANHLEHAPDQNRREVEDVAARLPDVLGAKAPPSGATQHRVDPMQLRAACHAAARALFAMPCTSPSQQLMADYSAKAMSGLGRGFEGLALMTNPTGPVLQGKLARLRVADWLPSIVNAVRVFVTLVAVELFWVLTAWPNGALAIVFAAITVILLAPQQDQAGGATELFLYGCLFSAVLAAIVEFAVLPKFVTFTGFAVVLGAVLVPLGAFAAQPWNGQFFMLATFNFIPILAPQNRMTYDTETFYNSTAAIIVGVLVSVVAFRLIPPLSPAQRTRRLLALTLRDLRRLIAAKTPPRQTDWENRIYGRLSVMPPQAELVQGAQLTAALSVGCEAIRLSRVAYRFGMRQETRAALGALAQGNSALAVTRLGAIDRALAAIPAQQPTPRLRLRARGSIRVITDALVQYRDYFDSGAIYHEDRRRGTR
jgi:uncharacterized membrane protein YccC